MPADSKSAAPWLSIVGIGEDGLDGLGGEAKRCIGEAEIVFGGKRHLTLAANAITGEARPWPVPFDSQMRAVTAMRGRRVAVLASGDPFCHGVGTTLVRHVPIHEIRTFPAPSAFSLAASRLGWSIPDIETVSLHGRPVDLIRPLLHAGTRILALTSDGDGPAAIARLLNETGFGASQLVVLEALAGRRERIRFSKASAFHFEDINELNVLAVDVQADVRARVLPLTSGVDDELFEHDGQITKREIRAVTLSALAPRRGELLWDIGAGSGSISIEWMLRHPSLSAIAIEAAPERAERVRHNAAACGVPGLQIIVGSAPGALDDLRAPDAIFIGGGGSEPGVLDAAIAALKQGGRLVANAVTLEMEAMLLEKRGELGGELVRLAITRAVPVGAMQGWKPAMPVTQWSWTKP